MSTTQQSLDRLLYLLANRRRRYTLYHLDEVEQAVIPLNELADHLVQWEREWDSREKTEHDTHRREIRIDLHHNQLPRLAEAGLIDYDARTQTIRKWDEPSLMQWAEDDVDELTRLRALLTTAPV